MKSVIPAFHSICATHHATFVFFEPLVPTRHMHIHSAGMANFEICGYELFKANWAVFRTVVWYDFVAFSPVVYSPGCLCGKLFAFVGKLNYC